MTDILLPDELGVGILTDFAFELGEVVGDGGFVLLHYHLGFDPAFQAVDVDDRTASLTATGGHEEVVGVRVLTQADLALPCQVFGNFVDLLARILLHAIG